MPIWILLTQKKGSPKRRKIVISCMWPSVSKKNLLTDRVYYSCLPFPTRIFPSLLCWLPLSTPLFSVWISLLCSSLLFSSLLYSALLVSSLLLSSLLFSFLLFSFLLFFSSLPSSSYYSTILFSTQFSPLYSTFLESTFPYSTLLCFTLLFFTLLSSPLLSLNLLYYFSLLLWVYLHFILRNSKFLYQTSFDEYRRT